MRSIQGIPVSPGIAIAPAFHLRRAGSMPTRRTIQRARVKAELQLYRDALEAARAELEAIAARAGLTDAIGSIAKSHREFLSDPTLIREIETTIQNGPSPADYAVAVVFNRWIEVFRQLTDEFFRQRYVDLMDLQKRVLRHLRKDEESEQPTPDNPVILVTEDLTPTEAAELDRTSFLGFATEHGGSTSHTAIIAKSLGIPALCGLGPLGATVPPGTPLICDGEQGILIVDPDPDTLRRYRERQELLHRRARVLRRMSALPAETPDGWPVGVFGNIEFPFEVDQAVRNGADGIGLFRTEFLYAERQSVPDEEGHLAAYREALSRLKGRTLTIRTFDFGADKFGESVGFQGEPNPFLGCRSIRLCFARPELFRTQLRAILRASNEGRISLLFPMIGSVTEFRSARSILENVKEELRRTGVPFDANLKVGAMIEIPSAALMADLLAREVDFFSVGSNDLTQYALAVDRTNERVANLFRPSNPAILRLLRNVVKEGIRAGVRVSLCGEMAAERPYTLLLLGMGIRHFSVAPNLVPEVKRVVRSVSRSDAAVIARTALGFATSEEVDSYLAEESARLLGEA